MKMKRRFAAVMVIALLVTAAGIMTSCSDKNEKTALKVIIIPKFEVGEMTGDFPGEAQLFYEKYCEGCEEADIPNMPEDSSFYVNEDAGTGILVTGEGKVSSALSLSAVLSSDFYDYSDAYIVSVGCAGGSAGYCTLGDVVLATAACDYDLGHHVDAHEKEDDGSVVMWFPDEDYDDSGHKVLNSELCEKSYELIKDCPLRTTELAKTVMAENFPDMSPEEILPSVKKGTTMSGDDYWKGTYGHETANYIAAYYECPDPYASTEMEEIAIANTADSFGLLDRLISLRVIVNMDVFLSGATPESSWGYQSFDRKIEEDNSETLDIFEPAMQNLFDTGSIIIDAVLAGDL